MRRGSLVLLVVLASLASLVPAAHADQGRLVTIAARSCPAYTDITANRARNNIMESLEDLGVDTPYGQGGRPLLVDPATEAEFQPIARRSGTGSSRSARATSRARSPARGAR